MNRFVLIFFAVIGLLDLMYGLVFQDRISIVVGLVITGIAFYAIKSKSKH